MNLRINTPNIVHETFADDEAAIINLESGNYYSLNLTGTVIWSLIEKNISREVIAREFGQYFDNSDSDIGGSVNRFIDKLLKEELVEAVETNTGGESIEIDLDLGDEFVEPVLERFADMQELLLLDPIHEINEKGFPKMKAVSAKP